MKKYSELTMQEKKEIWWNHLLESKNFWHYGWTKKRLEKRKDDIMKCRYTWADLMGRHSGDTYLPEQMMKHDNHVYQHGFSNFASNVGNILRGRE